MRCLSPLIAWRRKDRVGVTLKFSEGDSRFGLKLPCGTCTACLLERARQHAVKCAHEREMHARSCFITLTYDEEHLPYGASLVKEHFSNFMRELRKKFEEPIRFFACGEYGARWHRPHYHAILFGVDFFQDRFVSARRGSEVVYRSPCLESVWTMGRSEIGSASFESACYVARYVAKKCERVGVEGREPEFLLCSLKPGIGVPWLERYYRGVAARDSVVINGMEVRPPRLYDKWMEKNHPDLYRSMKERRRAGVLAPGEDPDDCSSRWEVMEEVLLAKLNRFQREVEV